MMKHLPCLFHRFLSVCSPAVLSLSFFFHSSSLLRFSALTPSSLLAVSCPFSRFVSFLSRHISGFVAMELCILQPSPLLSPEWAHLRTPSTTENFLFHVLPPFFLQSPTLYTHILDRKSAASPHKHTAVSRTVVRFCL